MNSRGRCIANNIRAERHRANYTIEELVKLIGVSKPTYIGYEKDASKLKLKTLLDLSEVFKCPVSSFFVK